MSAHVMFARADMKSAPSGTGPFRQGMSGDVCFGRHVPITTIIT